MAITDAEIADLSSRGYVSVLSKTVTLTDAQIKAVHSAPPELVPAAGAGKIIVPVRLIARTNGVNTGYVGADNFGSLAYTQNYADNGAGFSNIELATLLTASGGAPRTMIVCADAPSTGSGGGDTTLITNQPLYLWAGADLTSGDPAQTFTFTTLYTVVTVS